jgi:hypothetical protein
MMFSLRCWRVQNETLLPMPLFVLIVMEPTHGDYNVSEVSGIEKLQQRMSNAETIKEWSFILSDYISFGNSKIAKSVAIFNMNSATDCPNAEKDNCQVDFGDCYAHKAENMYKQTLPYRRRQEYLWDCLDAETWAKAFQELVSRKRNEVTAIRFSEAGDFRHKGDVIKVNRIAELVDCDVYTYSASDYLDWSEATEFTVNQSNNFSEYGDRLYSAVPKAEDIPEDGIQCPHDYQKNNGSDNPVKCGDCRSCISDEGPDVYITLH